MSWRYFLSCSNDKCGREFRATWFKRHWEQFPTDSSKCQDCGSVIERVITEVEV